MGLPPGRLSPVPRTEATRTKSRDRTFTTYILVRGLLAETGGRRDIFNVGVGVTVFVGVWALFWL